VFWQNFIRKSNTVLKKSRKIWSNFFFLPLKEELISRSWKLVIVIWTSGATWDKKYNHAKCHTNQVKISKLSYQALLTLEKTLVIRVIDLKILNQRIWIGLIKFNSETRSSISSWFSKRALILLTLAYIYLYVE